MTRAQYTNDFMVLKHYTYKLVRLSRKLLTACILSYLDESHNEICELITPTCFSDWSEAVILPVPMPPLPTILLPTHDITTSVSRSPAVTVTVTPGNSCTMTSLRMSDMDIFLNSSLTGSQLAFLCVWSHSWLCGSAIHYWAPLFSHGKSSLPKSMQPSIYPLGRCWTFSASQVYLCTAMIIITTVVNIITQR